MSSIKGIVKEVLALEQGESQGGKSWQKRGFVITTKDDYPKDICFSTFGEKVSMASKLSVGQEVEVSYNLSSREYNGKYYHNIDAWKVSSLSGAATAAPSSNDNLPF
jgi:hypothetical protein